MIPVLVLLNVQVVILTASPKCPQGCRCDPAWKSVRCKDVDLVHILPRGIPTTTQSLFITHQHQVNDEMTTRQNVDPRSSVNASSFAALKWLSRLELDGVYLPTIHLGMFDKVPELKVLSLRRCGLTTVGKGW